MEIWKPFAEGYQRCDSQFSDRGYWESKVNIIHELCIHENELRADQMPQDFKRRKWVLDRQKEDEQDERNLFTEP